MAPGSRCPDLIFHCSCPLKMWPRRFRGSGETAPEEQSDSRLSLLSKLCRQQARDLWVVIPGMVAYLWPACLIMSGGSRKRVRSQMYCLRDEARGHPLPNHDLHLGLQRSPTLSSAAPRSQTTPELWAPCSEKLRTESNVEMLRVARQLDLDRHAADQRERASFARQKTASAVAPSSPASSLFSFSCSRSDSPRTSTS